MAGSSEGHDSAEVTYRTVWTFIIRGGDPFELKVKATLGPALNHIGPLTVWKMMGTEEEAASIESMVTGPLIGARVERHTEIENPEMLAIRAKRLGHDTE